MPHRYVTVIPGDGVGPEIVGAAMHALDAADAGYEWVEACAGNDAVARHGQLVPSATLESVRETGAALKGPFFTPSGGTRRSPNYWIRRELDLYANIRPLRVPGRSRPTALVRENVEDLYAAIEWSPTPGVAQAVKVATLAGCERIARVAFDLATDEARQLVTVVHKANNLKLTEGLFLSTARGIAESYPSVRCDDLLVDTAAAEMVLSPKRFDVILTSNTFGDILSNVGAAVAGSPGLVPSLNRGDKLVVAEASHGDAEHLAGTGRVNPVAMIGAGAMLARALGDVHIANRIDTAIARLLEESSLLTVDLGGTATCAEVVDALVRDIRTQAAELRPA